jgi:glucose/arabinose dehydrogenase
MELINERPTRTPRRRPPLLALTGALLLGGVIATSALVITGATYLTPSLVAEKIIDCIGASATVAQRASISTPPTVVVSGTVKEFQSPTAVIAVSGKNLLVSERRGVITSTNISTGKRLPVLDLSAQVDATVEGGLLGMALHPLFGVSDESRLFLVYTRAQDRALTIASIDLSRDMLARIGSLKVLQIVPREDGWHAGGGIAFLPDGRLLVGIGDDSKPNEAQSKSSMLGKLVALDVDDPASGAVMFSSGLRNPFRITVDAEHQMLWVADVGQFCIEEVNRIPLAEAEGANFGWPMFEGSRKWPRYVQSDFGYGDGDKVKKPESEISLVEPITTYEHLKGGPCAVIGGAVVGEWYLFADYCEGTLLGIPIDADPGTKASELLNFNATSSKVGVIGVVHDDAGNTWALDGWGGALIQLDVTP